jgi:transcriptional regulator with XRE-family HTH domain
VAAARDPRHIGANVRRLRIAAGLTQLQLAEAADIVDATVSRIERGRMDPSSELLGRLASALRVRADDLLGPTKERGRPTQRPAIARLVAAVDGLDDGQVDDVTRGIRLLLAAGRRSARAR